MSEDLAGKLRFHPRFGGMVPFAVMIAAIVALALEGRAGTSQFWAGAYAGIAVGLLLCRNKSEYCQAIIRGICNETGILIIVAWIFASVLGKIVVSAGLVGGVLWLGEASGLEGRYFTLLAFLSAMLFSAGTGTANATVLALTPVLFPAGVALGAEPTFLALAILSGAAFGDNVAPISDTTILSAFTQRTSMKSVIRSRLPLASVSALLSTAVFVMFGAADEAAASSRPEIPANAASLSLLLALAIVVLSALANRHIIESLVYGTVTAIVIGVATDGISPEQLFAVPPSRGQSTGLIQDAVTGVVGPIVFVVLVMAIVQVFQESGLLDRLLAFIRTNVARTVRSTEFAIATISILVSSIVTSNGAAILLVGPTVARRLGERFGIAPYRCANLMDCGVCSVFYMLPWTLVVLVWYGAVESAAGEYGLVPPPITSALIGPYPWSLLLVLMISIATGWNAERRGQAVA